MKTIDALLNRITMYRLVMRSLQLLACVAVVLAFSGKLSFTAVQFALSLAILVGVSWLSNKVFALFTKAAPTPESAIITGFILAFIFTPARSISDCFVLAGIACIAMASKYVLAINKKHLLNPAAVAAFASSVFGIGLASWWIGTPWMLPFVLVLGLLIVRKIKRFDLFLSFIVVATIVFVSRLFIAGTPLGPSLVQFFLSWPLFFFAAIMVTEPQTTPPYTNDRFIFGAITGLIYSLSFAIGPVSSSPQLALIVANIYAYAVSFKRRVTLTLKERIPLTRDIFEFVFLPKKPFDFLAGQYAEWTLPHHKNDKRGIRRYFTIASAPDDPFVRLAMRVPVEGSSFKNRLKTLEPGSNIYMTGVGGTFVLPQDPNEKIAAIAGGIGITPFMSMFRHLAERREYRNITFFYAATSPLDFAYQQELDEIAPKIGLTILYLPTDYTEMTDWKGKSGYLTDGMIKTEVKDFNSRTWFVSGPDAMVKSYCALLKQLGVSSSQIRTDYFPGL